FPNRWLNACNMTTPNTAMASNPAVRDTALLIPDATPACSSPTELITVVVSGATVIDIPSPRTTTAGKKLVQKLGLTAGNVYSAKPTAAMIGPTVNGRRAPKRSIKPPDQRDNVNIITTNGSNEAPAAVAE